MTAPSPRSSWGVSYFGIVDGPTTAAPTSRYRLKPTGEIDTARPLAWIHEPALTYRWSGPWSLRMKLPFAVTATDQPEDSGFQADDPVFALNHADLVSFEGFRLRGGINISPSMTDYSRERQRTGEVGLSMTPEIRFGDTRWRFMSVTQIKQYLYESSKSFTARTRQALSRGRLSEIKAEAFPSLSYEVSDDWAAVLGGQLTYIQSRGNSEFATINNILALGVAYRWSRQLTLRPEVRFHDTQAITANNTHLGMLIFGSL